MARNTSCSIRPSVTRLSTAERGIGRRDQAPFRKVDPRANGNARNEEFWALRDVSFDVQEGEVVGIIGRNGAGKSTLLKVLSRITEPTAGRVTLRGRVASLLEVGTGFHPELTGRENILLNGAILGMTRSEIKRQFDEIVAFAEVEKFLDTPVKHYSSGMYVRLAFAVAAHLDSEILFVDEVLAVGDAEFQKRSLGKMSAVAKGGRTVLFVSHNMNAVQELCTKAVLLESGTVRQVADDVHAITTQHLFGNKDQVRKAEWINQRTMYDNRHFELLRFGLYDENGEAVVPPITNNRPVWVEIEGNIGRPDPALKIGYAVYDESGQVLYWSTQTDGAEAQWPRLSAGRCLLRSRLPSRLLNEGTYRLEMIGTLHCREWLYEPNVSAPSVTLTIQGGLSDSPYWMAPRPGILAQFCSGIAARPGRSKANRHSCRHGTRLRAKASTG